MRRAGTAFTFLALCLGLAHLASGAVGATVDYTQDCDKYGDFGMTHGACMSFFAAASPAQAAAIFAVVCDRPEVRASVGALNTGDCVAALLGTGPAAGG